MLVFQHAVFSSFQMKGSNRVTSRTKSLSLLLCWSV